MGTNTQRIARLRETIAQTLADAAERFAGALRPEGSNVFVWHGEEFWVDRVRRLIFPALGVAAWRTRDTLPDDGELGDATTFLEVYGGSARLEDTGQILNLFARIMRGIERHPDWTATGAHVLNLAIAQPTINPAFGPLLWLALADDAGPCGHRTSFYDLVGPMMYEQRSYPEQIPSAVEVRAAQIAFLERLAPGATDPGCAELSDVSWAARCAAQLERRSAFVDNNFWVDVLSRVGAAARQPGAAP